ncbi:endonuclease/exonuclease/phosphatase family protein [Vibrio sp. RC27]
MSIQNPLVLFALLSTAFNVNAQSLNIMSWNFEWLSSTQATQVNESKRSKADLNAYRTIIEKRKPNVIAFQEVNDLGVLNKVLGKNFNIIMSDRATSSNQSLQYRDINQYTGVAINKSLTYSDPKDIVLSPNRKLRFASYVVLEPKNSSPIHLLSVHLKAGCIGKYLSKEESCVTLKQQSKQLHEWINQRNAKNQPFLILGDFNHDLTYRGDWMWREISADTKPSPNLLSSKLESECVPSGKTKRHRYLVDHMIASSDISAKSISQILYSLEDQRYQLSDHCPLAATLNY